jgi:hypothetical protein
LRKIAEQEIEKIFHISLIERKNKYDYKLYFSDNIMLETFELSEGRDYPPLYLTDGKDNEVLDIGLLCDFRTREGARKDSEAQVSGISGLPPGSARRKI